VRWRVLALKYEERHNARLDVQALGFASPLEAVTSLLRDLLGFVDVREVHDPVLGLADAATLVPRHGALGCWPSLYHALCNIVTDHGAPAGPPVSQQCRTMGCRAADGQPCTLLLSRVRPLLEREYQINVDESSLGFLNEDGAFVRLNKLKHLVHALLKWRDQRQAWQRSRQLEGGAMDRLLEPHLQLLASGPGSDLVLRCSPGGASAAPTAAAAEAPGGEP